MVDWLTEIEQAKKSCFANGNSKKIHYNFPNGKEMMEEYNMETGVLTKRAWKREEDMKGKYEWDVEVGDPEPTYGTDEQSKDICESSNQPFVSRRNTRKILEWRIKNLPYAIGTYSVTVNPEGNCLIVRTTNKKYYKKLKIPELSRLNLVPEQSSVSFSHKFNTLIITYKKPKELLNYDKIKLEMVQSIKSIDEEAINDAPAENFQKIVVLENT